MRQSFVLTALLALAACAGKDAPVTPMTQGTVPRDGRGNAVLEAVPPPPLAPPPVNFTPAAKQADCRHLRHC